MPRLGDNALLKLAPLLERLGARQPDYDLGAEPRAFLEAIGESPDGDLHVVLDRIRAAEPRLAPLLEPMMGVSLAPTRISASAKINVIPASAQLQVDCRVPPGLGEAQTLRRIREVLGDDGYRLDFTEQVVGNRSPVDSPMTRFIGRWIAARDPEATLAPVVLPGFTDSRTFRDAFPECDAYGFFPHSHRNRYETDPLIHGADERIDVRDLGFAAEFFRDLAVEMLS
jgi:acetylornithine deacetylase/succinyl-diaminopimelate desuccinylase-like protein